MLELPHSRPETKVPLAKNVIICKPDSGARVGRCPDTSRASGRGKPCAPTTQGRAAEPVKQPHTGAW